MSFKIVAVLSLLAVVNAGVLPAAQVYHAAPAAQVYHAAPFAHVYHAAPAAPVHHAAPAAQVYHAAPPAVVKTVNPVAHYAAHSVLAKADDEYDPHPQYKYGYNVQDAASGDSKGQVEERNGDVVRGEYSLIDADGYKRTVKYTADDHNGFNAVVEREPLVKAENAHSIVKTYTPVAHYAAPSVVKTVAPAAHYAATTYSSPAAHH